MNLKSSFLVLIFAIFTSACASHKVVQYQTKDQHTFKADLFLPSEKSATPLPLVVVIHGGGWKSRSGDMESICKHLTNEGYAALNITYRLAPDYHYPVQLNDVKAVIPWIVNEAKKYNLNEKEISLWGYSAGAQLAFLLGNDKSLPVKINAIVVGGIPSYFPSFPDSPLITPYIGSTYVDNPKAWAEASPLEFVSKDTPPTYIYQGIEDDLVGINQADILAVKLAQYKVKHQINRVENRGHISLYFFPKDAEDKAIKFIKDNSN